jgi:hypothetical protein
LTIDLPTSVPRLNPEGRWGGDPRLPPIHHTHYRAHPEVIARDPHIVAGHGDYAAECSLSGDHPGFKNGGAPHEDADFILVDADPAPAGAHHRFGNEDTASFGLNRAGTESF